MYNHLCTEYKPQSLSLLPVSTVTKPNIFSNHRFCCPLFICLLPPDSTSLFTVAYVFKAYNFIYITAHTKLINIHILSAQLTFISDLFRSLRPAFNSRFVERKR